MRRLLERPASYRPVLDRVVFALAVLGLLNSAHIAIQQQRGFEEGCTGFSASFLAGPAFDCGTVTSSAAATLFGVSNSVWGILFYLAVALLTAAAAFDVGGKLAQFKALRGALVAGGFLYSLYLVYYQFGVIEQLCALCLLSAGIVATLFALITIDMTRPAPTDTDSPKGMTRKPVREMAYMGALVVLLGILIGADAVYFANREAPDVFGAEATASAPTVVADTGEPDEALASLPAECRYDPEKGRVQDYQRLVNFFDPTVGDPSAEVTVIEYFDPNCPHCKTLHEIMMPVVQTHADRALFVFKPFVLWQHSVAQSEALYAAAQEGKFFDMLSKQYEIQQPQTGLGPEQLRAIAAEIGMNPDQLIQRLESGVFQRTLLEEKQEGIDIGVNSTPTVLINGRFVAADSRTEECLRTMIEAAANS